MSNPRYGAVPAGHIGIGNVFVNADALLGKVIMEPQPQAAAVSLTSPLFYGGASVYDLIGYSSDSVAKDILFYRGDVLTTVGTATGATTTTASTVVRTSGDNAADGWRVGMQVMLFAPSNVAAQATEGILCVVSAVSALTLTFSGTPLSALTLTTGTRIVAVKGLWSGSIAAGAGNSSSTAEAWLLSTTNVTATRVKDEKFSAAQMLIGAAKVAVTASTVIAISGSAARY